MNKNTLEYFYNDEHTREDFKAFQLAVLDEMVLKDCYNNGGDNAKALQHTKKLIDESYKRLSEIFGRKDTPNKEDPR